MKKYIIAITGASGAVYGKRLVEFLCRMEVKVFLLFSTSGLFIFSEELGVKLPEKDKLPGFFKEYFKNENLEYLDNSRLSASVASGSYQVDGMVVVPASMGCIGRIAGGISSNLIERAADVMLKEKRKLVIVPRETPLNIIHLENMLKIAKIGGVILPAMPAFYAQSKTIDNLVDFITGRVLESLDNIDHELYPRWK